MAAGSHLVGCPRLLDLTQMAAGSHLVGCPRLLDLTQTVASPPPGSHADGSIPSNSHGRSHDPCLQMAGASLTVAWPLLLDLTLHSRWFRSRLLDPNAEKDTVHAQDFTSLILHPQGSDIFHTTWHLSSTQCNSCGKVRIKCCLLLIIETFRYNIQLNQVCKSLFCGITGSNYHFFYWDVYLYNVQWSNVAFYFLLGHLDMTSSTINGVWFGEHELMFPWLYICCLPNMEWCLLPWLSAWRGVEVMLPWLLTCCLADMEWGYPDSCGMTVIWFKSQMQTLKCYYKLSCDAFCMLWYSNCTYGAINLHCTNCKGPSYTVYLLYSW